MALCRKQRGGRAALCEVRFHRAEGGPSAVSLGFSSAPVVVSCTQILFSSWGTGSSGVTGLTQTVAPGLVAHASTLMMQRVVFPAPAAQIVGANF